jgi:hypothetical protein
MLPGGCSSCCEITHGTLGVVTSRVFSWRPIKKLL